MGCVGGKRGVFSKSHARAAIGLVALVLYGVGIAHALIGLAPVCNRPAHSTAQYNLRFFVDYRFQKYSGDSFAIGN